MKGLLSAAEADTTSKGFTKKMWKQKREKATTPPNAKVVVTAPPVIVADLVCTLGKSSHS